MSAFKHYNPVLCFKIFIFILSCRRVHITETTFELVKDFYEVEDGEGGKRNDYLKENSITTYLVGSKKKQDQSSTVNMLCFCF